MLGEHELEMRKVHTLGVLSRVCFCARYSAIALRSRALRLCALHAHARYARALHASAPPYLTPYATSGMLSGPRIGRPRRGPRLRRMPSRV